jgi:hypothetical protein
MLGIVVWLVLLPVRFPWAVLKGLGVFLLALMTGKIIGDGGAEAARGRRTVLGDYRPPHPMNEGWFWPGERR